MLGTESTSNVYLTTSSACTHIVMRLSACEWGEKSLPAPPKGPEHFRARLVAACPPRHGGRRRLCDTLRNGRLLLQWLPLLLEATTARVSNTARAHSTGRISTGARVIGPGRSHATKAATGARGRWRAAHSLEHAAAGFIGGQY